MFIYLFNRVYYVMVIYYQKTA